MGGVTLSPSLNSILSEKYSPLVELEATLPREHQVKRALATWGGARIGPIYGVLSKYRHLPACSQPVLKSYRRLKDQLSPQDRRDNRPHKPGSKLYFLSESN